MFDLDLTIVFTNLNASAKLVKAVKAVKGAIVLSLTPFPLNIILIKVFRCNCISILAAGWLVVGWSLTQNRLTHWPLANTLWCYGVNSCQLWVGHMAWAPEGREEQSQKLEAYLIFFSLHRQNCRIRFSLNKLRKKKQILRQNCVNWDKTCNVICDMETFSASHKWWMWRRNVRFLHISHVIREIREICHTEISEISPHDRFSPQVPPGKYQVWLDQPLSPKICKRHSRAIC